MSRRPFLKFYVGDWRGNTKLRGASLQDRAAWLEVLCLFHDSDEYGVLRWDLKKIASTIPCHVNILQSLKHQRILKGADAGEDFAGFTHTDRHGATHILINPCRGPVWFSSRMVLDSHLERIASITGKKGGNPTLKGVVNPHPKPHISESRVQSISSPPQRGRARSDFNPLTVDIPLMLDSPAFRDVWAKWCAHRREKRKPLTPTSVGQQLDELASWGQPRAIAAIRHTIAKGWEGIREPETPANGQRTTYGNRNQQPRGTVENLAV